MNRQFAMKINEKLWETFFTESTKEFCENKNWKRSLNAIFNKPKIRLISNLKKYEKNGFNCCRSESNSSTFIVTQFTNNPQDQIYIQKDNFSTFQILLINLKERRSNLQNFPLTKTNFETSLLMLADFLLLLSRILCSKINNSWPLSMSNLDNWQFSKP